MEFDIESRINALLSQMEVSTLSPPEVAAIQGKIDYLRTLQD